MTIDKQALREAAEKARTARARLEALTDEDVVLFKDDDIKSDISVYNKFIVMANPDAVLPLLDEREATEKRIAELEAREVTLPPTFWYEHDDLSRDVPVLDKRLVKKAIRAAGIGVKGE
ncbi:ead/Ea22-like family protein [Salmonella enterica]